jgi:preprotein translocase subunit SecA
MDDIFDNDDNAEDFACNLDEEKDEGEKEIENKEQINKKINDIQNNIEESWIFNIKKFLEEINENSEELAVKLNQICKDFKFYENSKRLDLIKKIIKDSYNHSRINFSQRLIDFSEFLLSEPHLEYDIIEQAINNVNLEKISTINKDIIYFWKENVVEKYCSFLNDKNGLLNYAKKIIQSLLEENFNIAEIYSILYPFRYFLSNEKFSQFEILDSIISIIIAYKINQMDDELIKIINENTIQNKANSIVELNSKVALEFYLKASKNKKNNESSPLNIPQLLLSLKNMNSELTDDIIREREEQLYCIKSIVDNQRYKDYEKQDFKRWAKNEFPKLNFEKDANESTAKVLGMISLAIKKENGFLLRNSQLIAILMFIGKEKKYGLIEEISTGEGKSNIICSLSIYFGLRKKKVDIISSSYSLAQRDSEDFENIYDYFNLTTSYPRNYDSYPYKCDILYGTFLEFEGDCLRELISDKKIRNNRPFEVIIIDEVDNLFIDNILSSTRLTGSTKGFKFLIPIYLSYYLSFELYDFLFLFFFSLNLKKIDQKKRQKYEKLIKEPEYRKKIIIKLTENIFKSLKNNAPEIEDEELIELLPKPKEIDDKYEKRGKKMLNKIEDFIQTLEKYLKYPDFLNSFVELQVPFWTNNAFIAKNYMDKFIDYVITEGKDKDVAPVDRTNTGETELSTVYCDGLHQMLEIKEKLRIKDETLTDTFLSHITFFQKYKNSDEFLFFGLTGTIGDNETQKIYKRDYFNSKLLFIPQYKKKRFIELPPKLSNILEHLDNICEDIIINYSYGRKILVICESIKEAQQLHKQLLTFDIKKFKEKNPFVKEDYKNFILLYTRSDTSEKENYKNKIMKIILSTNIGGRGTNIITNEEQEENGGMHVILTSMPSNYRVLKQAFGRTSREGKKGTGQIIIKKDSYQSYSDVVEEMIANEKERIEKIQKHLKIILFKDKLFIDFCGTIKHLDKNTCIFDDIRERWAMFLKENISKYTVDDFNEFEIEINYKKFKNDIEKSLNVENDYDKYNNPFIKIEAGIRKYKKFENNLSKYLDIKMENKKFFFVIPYLKAIILVKNQKNKYNKEFYEKLIGFLNETKKSVQLLIKNSIDPVLKSFPQWNEVFNNLKLEINENIDENINKMEEEIVDIETKILEKEDFYRQYLNIKNILEKIINKINSNLDFVEKYRISYGDNQNYFICPIKKDLDEGLQLNELEEKEINFFYDASFYYVFDFTEKLRITESFIMKLYIFLIFLVFLPLAIATLVIGSISLLAFYSGKALYNKIRIRSSGNLEIENNSIFSNLLYSIIQKFRYENEVQQRALLNAENENEDEFISYQSLKKSLRYEFYEKLEIEFNYIKKLDIIKFLYFIDIYLSNEFWSKKIIQIIKKISKIFMKLNSIKNYIYLEKK